MARTPNSQRRLEDSLRRLFERGAANSQPDVTRYEVMIDGQPFLIGERTNEIVGDKTISTYKAQLDDQGRTYVHINQFQLCSCGCRVNIKVQKVYRCHFCKRIVCSIHSKRSDSIKVTICQDKKCVTKLRLLQLGHYANKSLIFCGAQIFGFEVPLHRPSLEVQGGDDEFEEDEIKELDEERRFRKRRGRESDFD